MSVVIPSFCNERFISFIWRYQLIDWNLTNHEFCKFIEVISPGIPNHDAGPDFLNAKVKIDDVLWVGNIEIHVKSSEWYQHNHDTDQGYDNVLFQVVYLNDKVVNNATGKPIPNLIVRWKSNLDDYMSEFSEPGKYIPCEKNIVHVDQFTKNQCVESMAIERLEAKTQRITKQVEENNGDWKQTFYEVLLRYFGFKINGQPFEMLARNMPYNLLIRHRTSLKQIEALLFGVAGFLDQNEKIDSFYEELKQEFEFLCYKYNLTRLQIHLWKFLRTRPANFPTIRIAQLATLCCKFDDFFFLITEKLTLKEYQKVFELNISEYWQYHYKFGKKLSKPQSFKISNAAINLILINTIIPFKFAYSVHSNNYSLKLNALDLFESLPPERNSIVAEMERLGFIPGNALHSQGILQLQSVYCANVNCVECQVGNALMSSLA